MKRWAPCVCIWLDASGADRGWEDPKNLDHKPTKVTTVGMLYKHDKNGVTIVHNRNNRDIGGFTFIPAVNIKSLKELRER